MQAQRLLFSNISEDAARSDLCYEIIEQDESMAVCISRAMCVTSFSLCGSCHTCDEHVRIFSRVLPLALCALQLENVQRCNRDILARILV